VSRALLLHFGGTLASFALVASQSASVHAAGPFDGVWIIRQDNLQRCAFTPPPDPIRIINGALVGLDGTVSPSGKIGWSGTSKLGNRFLFSGRLRRTSRCSAPGLDLSCRDLFPASSQSLALALALRWIPATRAFACASRAGMTRNPALVART